MAKGKECMRFVLFAAIACMLSMIMSAAFIKSRCPVAGIVITAADKDEGVPFTWSGFEDIEPGCLRG
eukprot:3625221-Rhodomonas_salina.1